MTPAPRNPFLSQAAASRLQEIHGGPAPRVFFAPGRVNLLGAHLDYSGGNVLPMAADKGVYAAARPRRDGRLLLHSLDQTLQVDTEIDALRAVRDPHHAWAGYPLGVFKLFSERTGLKTGVELVFASDLPMASGLSSSAAIEIATAVALDRLHETAMSAKDLALLCHRAENEYVGLRCGIMDQFASALARPSHVLLLHCVTQTFEHVPVDPEALDVLVLDTRKSRELAVSGFNERVRECADAFAILSRVVEPRRCLAEYTPEEVERARPELGELLFRRARHVATEMERVTDGVLGLRSGDLARLGAALDGSHHSSRDDYEVSCRELDVITEAAREMDAVFGARLTGAGFGGCAIALVRPDRSDEVMAHVRQRFTATFGIEPRFDLLRPGPGPCEIPQTS